MSIGQPKDPKSGWESYDVIERENDFAPVTLALQKHRAQADSAARYMERLEDMGFDLARTDWFFGSKRKHRIVQPDKFEPPMWELKCTPHKWRLFFMFIAVHATRTINELFTYMPTTRLHKSKTLPMSQPPANTADDWSPEVLPRSDLNSLSGILNAEQTVRLDNDVKHQVAAQLIHLRRFRGYSQTKVAKEMGTSQPAVARIESGEENFTADRLERHIGSLNGRLLISILPEEYQVQQSPPWWETRSHSLDGWVWGFIHQVPTPQSTKERMLFYMERDTTVKSLVALNAYGKETRR